MSSISSLVISRYTQYIFYINYFLDMIFALLRFARTPKLMDLEAGLLLLQRLNRRIQRSHSLKQDVRSRLLAERYHLV